MAMFILGFWVMSEREMRVIVEKKFIGDRAHIENPKSKFRIRKRTWS